MWFFKRRRLPRSQGQPPDRSRIEEPPLEVREKPPASMGRRVAWVAEAVNDEDLFNERALRVAQELGTGAVAQLPYFIRYDSLPSEPAGFTYGDSWLGAWLSACQHTVFRILFYLGESAVPVVRQVAFGPYDWTQVEAVLILGRWASEGIETERTTRDLCIAFPAFRYEAQLPTMQALARIHPAPPHVRETLLEQCEAQWTHGDPVDALVILGLLAACAPDAVRERHMWLRALIRGAGLHGRDPVQDGAVVSEMQGNVIRACAMSTWAEETWVAGTPPVADQHAIYTALLLRYVLPQDAEATASLRRWEERHPDVQVREHLRSYREAEETRSAPD